MGLPPLHKIQIILVGTHYSGNIGSVARAMKNMGLCNLVLVKPLCDIDDEALQMATHARDILLRAQTVTNLSEAIAGSSYAFGTTSRLRKWRTFITPSEMAMKVSSLIKNNRVSLVFGPEDSGLTNVELEMCNEIISIPTADNGGSLNLAQAVMVICYEVYGRTQKAGEGKSLNFATSNEVEAMYVHMRNALLGIGYLNPQNPEHIIGKFRRILTRAGLKTEDVRLIRGIFRQLQWYIRRKSHRGSVDTERSTQQY
jgi:tRNA/rRNA methyltransferase